MLPMPVARSSSDKFTIGRIPIVRKGFSSPLKMHYWPGKGDGSAQRGRSMLSTIALSADVTCYETSRFAWLLNNNRGRRVIRVAVCRALCVLYDTRAYLENKYALNFMPSFTTGRDDLPASRSPSGQSLHAIRRVHSKTVLL